MPDNGYIVFCTFYNSLLFKKGTYNDEIMYKKTSALTILRFVHKTTKTITNIPLYQNSALFIDLNTNANYTHEIVPPNLSSTDVPTRLGYVVRCSKQNAKYTDKTYIKSPNGEYVSLTEPTPEVITQLKKIYRDENMNSERPQYPFFDFSLNTGDYRKPIKSDGLIV
jgi:hypothetical protein